MNALSEIQNKAQVIVNELADREITRMKDRYNEYIEWVNKNGNAILDKYHGNSIDNYSSTEKYIYMTQFRTWNNETREYELPTEYPTSYRDRREMLYNRSLSTMLNELRMMLHPWESKYREIFVSTNMMKLNRALAKHLNDEMTASNIQVEIGGDGAEVLADVDGKLFKTFGTLCGGYIQCLHYRYRSSLK